MEFNWFVLFISAIVPLITGFVWYHPSVMGSAWMKACGFNQSDLEKTNMVKLFILTYVFGLLISVALIPVVVHQLHIGSIFADDPGMKDPNSESSLYIKSFMDTYGQRFRSFKHGAFHAVLTTIFLVLPIIGTVAMYERKSLKYAAIHIGYWLITLMLMGGIICQWL